MKQKVLVFMRKMVTHAEVWSFYQYTGEEPEEYFRNMESTFEDRQGTWWMLCHDHFNTNERAEKSVECILEYGQDADVEVILL